MDFMKKAESDELSEWIVAELSERGTDGLSLWEDSSNELLAKKSLGDNATKPLRDALDSIKKARQSFKDFSAILHEKS